MAGTDFFTDLVAVLQTATDDDDEQPIGSPLSEGLPKNFLLLDITLDTSKS